MYKYRISKYDPQYRDQKGAYCREDWTSYSDIGQIYNGKLFSKDDYIKTETLYCNAVLNILKINNVNELVLDNLELNFSCDEMKQMLQSKGLDLSMKAEMAINSLKNGDKISISELPLYLKLILRECFWCELTDAASSKRIGFGFDYYIYLYSESILSEELIKIYKQEGLFIEKMCV